MSRAALLLALAMAASAPAWVWNPYHLHTLIMAGIFAVLALSLNLLLGYTGQLSLGHAAFFGIGAYATGLLTVKLEWSPWTGLLAAILLLAVGGTIGLLERSRVVREVQHLWAPPAGIGEYFTLSIDFGATAPDTDADPLVLGRIEIPRLGVSAIVREGDDEETLAIAVGHVPGTARPGERGNMALAGHRDSFFRALRESGVEFLSVPSSYYDIMAERVGPIDEPVDEIRRLGLLVDRVGRHHAGGPGGPGRGARGTGRTRGRSRARAVAPASTRRVETNAGARRLEDALGVA